MLNYMWLLRFVPGIGVGIEVIIKAVQPLLDFLVHLLVDFFHTLKDGLKDIVDSWKTVFTVLFLMWSSVYIDRNYYYERHVAKPAIREQVIKELRKDYRFVPRNKSTTLSEPQTTIFNPLTWRF